MLVLISRSRSRVCIQGNHVHTALGLCPELDGKYIVHLTSYIVHFPLPGKSAASMEKIFFPRPRQFYHYIIFTCILNSLPYFPSEAWNNLEELLKSLVLSFRVKSVHDLCKKRSARVDLIHISFCWFCLTMENAIRMNNKPSSYSTVIFNQFL